jgi:hypothetical protein
MDSSGIVFSSIPEVISVYSLVGLQPSGNGSKKENPESTDPGLSARHEPVTQPMADDQKPDSILCFQPSSGLYCSRRRLLRL